MLKLTLEAIRKHPWYVLTSELPREPSEALLMSAVLAAWYCRESESLFTVALRNGDFVPMFCETSDEISDYIEGSKELSLCADRKIKEIRDLLENKIKKSVG